MPARLRVLVRQTPTGSTALRGCRPTPALRPLDAVHYPVLVTAASRHAATREIAEAIAAGLVRRGIDAQAVAVEDVHELDEYSAVVLGSAVYLGRWLRPAMTFAAGNAALLQTMPVWLFSSGPLGPREHPLPATGPADVEEMMTLTGARMHRLFRGRLDRDSLGHAERIAVRAVHAPLGDGRDWREIDEFAADIAGVLDPVTR